MDMDRDMDGKFHIHGKPAGLIVELCLHQRSVYVA